MLPELFPTFASAAIAIAATMLIVWLASLKLKDVSIIDIVWGLGFVLVAWTAFLVADGALPPGENADSRTSSATTLWLPILTTIWGLRLSGYLFWRKHGEAEDYRYRKMREKWGSWFPLVSLFTVFALQGVLMWIISLPVQVGTTLAAAEGTVFTWLGTLLWGVGQFFEAVGDWQLARFKADPANEGRVLNTGLWRYTRHPNYFGDFLVWWGMYVVSVSLTGIWWTIIGPVVMSILLMKISGVTLLEKSLKEKKPQYAEYAQRTNAFFPGPPAGQ